MNRNESTTYYVTEINPKTCAVICTIAGMGHNKGTLDMAANSRRTAQRWLAKCRKDFPNRSFVVCSL